MHSRSRALILLGVGALAMLFLGLTSVYAETGRTPVIVESCTSCHGPEGISQTEMPIIAGMAVEDMTAALLAYRDKSRPATIMHRLVATLNDDDIAVIAAYFANIKGAR